MRPLDCPVGSVVAYAGPVIGDDSSEQGKQDTERFRTTLFRQGWLVCDGTRCSREAFWQLYVVIGTRFGGDGTTFLVPDLRGYFVRGADNGVNRDPDAGSRTPGDPGKQPGSGGDLVGSTQLDAFQGHEHDYESVGPTVAIAEGSSPAFAQSVQKTTTDIATAGPKYQDPRIAAETRPMNLALNYLIRFR